MKLYFNTNTNTLFIAETSTEGVELNSEEVFEAAFAKVYTGEPKHFDLLKECYYKALNAFAEEGFKLTIKEISTAAKLANKDAIAQSSTVPTVWQWSKITHADYLTEYKDKFVLGVTIHELAHSVQYESRNYGYSIHYMDERGEDHGYEFRHIVNPIQFKFNLNGFEQAYVNAELYKKIKHHKKK